MLIKQIGLFLSLCLLTVGCTACLGYCSQSGASSTSQAEESSKTIQNTLTHGETPSATETSIPEDSISAPYEIWPYVPFDDVDYTLEKLELPMEEGYETTVLGYLSIGYKKNAGIVPHPSGQLDLERMGGLSEEERILPAFHPEGLGLIYRSEPGVLLSCSVYDSATPPKGDPMYEPSALSMRQNLSPQYTSLSYSEHFKLFIARTDTGEYLVTSVQDINGEDTYHIYFDDGTYFFALNGTAGVSLDEMIKMTVSLGRPCRVVEEGYGSDELAYPDGEKVDLQYLPTFKMTVGKCTFEYDIAESSYYYVHRGFANLNATKLPNIPGYTVKKSNSNDIVFTSETYGSFLYRVYEAKETATFWYGNGVSLYKTKVGDHDAFIWYETEKGEMQSLALYFSDGENDYFLKTESHLIGPEMLIEAAMSIEEGEFPS